MSHHAQALLFAVFVALVFAAGFGAALWLDLSRAIDEATHLPQHPRVLPATHDRQAEPPTERIAHSNVHDLRRTRSTFEETA